MMHLIIKQRYVIYSLCKASHTLSYISKDIEMYIKNTVGRELKHNSY